VQYVVMESGSSNLWRTTYNYIGGYLGFSHIGSQLEASNNWTGEKDIHFLLWTRFNDREDESYTLIPGDTNSFNQSSFNASAPIFFLLHGFNDHGKVGWIINTKTELLRLYRCNVISIDWSVLVKAPWYIQGVNNIHKVARITGGMIDWLHLSLNVSSSQVHIIGHSLGAHAAGLSARAVTTGKVSRVTGLDPAGPLFYSSGPGQRLDKSDALFVDVIHTNGGTLIERCQGLYKPVGHIDFYPNGGQHQPGCEYLDFFGACSHMRSTTLWVESLRQMENPHLKTFTSWPCTDWWQYTKEFCTKCDDQSCLNMGMNLTHKENGTHFLRTNKHPPYAKGNVR
ncbi:unnamed protein product, partial [Meganyctiphanes norvegica]